MTAATNRLKSVFLVLHSTNEEEQTFHAVLAN